MSCTNKGNIPIRVIMVPENNPQIIYGPFQFREKIVYINREGEFFYDKEFKVKADIKVLNHP